MLLSESNRRNLAAPVSVAPLSPFARHPWPDMAGEKDSSGPKHRDLYVLKIMNLLHSPAAVQTR